MMIRQRLACSTAPIFLRIALAVVFLFAGIGKLQSTEYSPADAARLANMGVARFAPPSAGSQQPPAAQPSDAGTPPTTPPAQAGGGFLPLVQTQEGEQPQPAGQPPAEQPAPPPPAVQPGATTTPDGQTAPQTAPAAQYTAADYAGPMRGRQLFQLALAIDGAAHPADGGRAIWPKSLARGKQPAWIAWAVALVEIAGGALALVGALARIAGLALGGVMVGALWLTSIGPFLLGGQSGWAGFLPPMADFAAWQTFLLQLTVFCAATALLFAGGGALSVDRLVFGAPGAKPADDDEEV